MSCSWLIHGTSLHRNAAALALLLLMPLALLFPAKAWSQQFFRYLDEDGRVVVVDRVPPEAIPRGYEILDKYARVVKTIPRQLNDTERAAQALEENARQAKALAEAKVLEWDQSLLRRYSSIGDITLAKTRAINEVQIRIDILKNNLESVIAQVAAEQTAAANYERRSGRVPEDIVRDIAEHKQDVGEAQRLIVVRERELAAVSERYDKDIARFSKLHTVVENRRQATISNQQE